MGVDINEIDGVDIGSTGSMTPEGRNLAGEVAQAALHMNDVRTVIGPNVFRQGNTHGSPKTPRRFQQGSGVWASHQSHLHITFFDNSEKKP